MKKQILILSIAIGAYTLNAQTTQPTDKQQKGTQQKGTQKETEQNGSDQNGTQKNTQQKGSDQNGTQKGTQQPGKKTDQQKGMRQSGTDESEMGSGMTPPSTISNKFNTDNPNIDANWSLDGDNYNAEFKDRNTNMGKNVVYDRNGNIIRTDNEMSSDGINYPSSIGEYHSKNFPSEGYKIWQTEDEKGNKWFYSKRKGGTIWFDKDGKYYPGKQGKSEQKMEDKSKIK